MSEDACWYCGSARCQCDPLYPDSEFISGLSPESLEKLKPDGRGDIARNMILSVQLGRTLNCWEDLQLRNSGKLIPPHFKLPVHIAFVTWCEVSETLVVMVKTTLTVSEYNRFMLLGRTTVGL